MKADIENTEEIRTLVAAFYKKLISDDVLGPVAAEMICAKWSKHLSAAAGFWENVIFLSGGYTGNPMMIHSHLHKTAGLDKQHFERWIELFHQTVDELFEGDRADLAKERSAGIAKVMEDNIIIKSGTHYLIN
ncbi:MAG TPA: group III truncated hemoglobin [Chitinophagaceae bacterium]|nr:group III truncated hemoglobin [Chitinophagaceae bacterium]